MIRATLLLILTIMFALCMNAAEAQRRLASSTGTAIEATGQRQERVSAVTGAQPMARLDTRINNRIQLRIGNRMGRNYTPQINVTSSFSNAADQVRRGSSTTPR